MSKAVSTSYPPLASPREPSGTSRPTCGKLQIELHVRPHLDVEMLVSRWRPAATSDRPQRRAR
jgi:hypothetical protein